MTNPTRQIGEAEREIVRVVVERAEQACRYALKHQEFETDEEGTDRYRDGWETAAEVCEKSIAGHVERHLEADLLEALGAIPASDLSTITRQRDEAVRLLREWDEFIGGVPMPDCPTMTRGLAACARTQAFLATVEDKP